MAMLAEPIAAASVGVVVMSVEEARACVDRIKRSLEDVRGLIFDLREREGWRALGYATWQDCIRDEFAMSRQRAHQLINAYMVDRILADGDDVNNVDAGPVPESHARELAPIIDEPEAVRAVVAKVKERKGIAATAADVREAVDEHLTRPARAPKAKSERRSVSSRAEAVDFADDAPDYADQSQETYGDAPNAEQPCTACGGEIVVLSEQDDRTRAASINAAIDEGRPIVQFCERCQTGEDAPADQSGDAAEAGVWAPADASDSPTSDADPAAPPADSRKPHPSQQPDRPLDHHDAKGSSGDKGNDTKRVSAARVFSPRGLDAADVTRALLDLPIADVAEALQENATPAQRQAFQRAFGGGEPEPAATPAPAEKIDIRDALGDDGCTVLSLSTAIEEVYTVDARASLLALLADAMPADRLGPLAHRLTVRMRNTGDLIEPEPIAEPSLPALDTDEQRVAYALDVLRQCGSKTLLAVEMKLPMIRKEVGARERAAANGAAQ